MTDTTSGHQRLGLLLSDGTFMPVTDADEGQTFGPQISPNGKMIAFVRVERGSRLGLRIANFPFGKPIDSRYIDEVVSTPAWSPDGNRVAYCNAGVWVVNSDASGRRRLVSEDRFRVSCPSWSPAGDRILYARRCDVYGDIRDLIYGGEPKVVDLFTVDHEGTVVRRLTRDRRVSARLGEDYLGGVWSPDGRWIAYTAHSDGVNQLFVCANDGTEQRQLTHGRLRAFNPQWLPDGTGLVFARETKSGGQDLTTIKPDGAGLRTFGIETLDVFWPVCLPSPSPKP